jgi:hypothetical protein
MASEAPSSNAAPGGGGSGGGASAPAPIPSFDEPITYGSLREKVESLLLNAGAYATAASASPEQTKAIELIGSVVSDREPHLKKIEEFDDPDPFPDSYSIPIQRVRLTSPDGAHNKIVTNNSQSFKDLLAQGWTDQRRMRTTP